jgi:cobalamin biosynthesis protein CobD/CbiB
MTENNDRRPVATLHRFLEEASDEFGRFRFQATVNLIGSIVLLILVIRSAFLFSVIYMPHMIMRRLVIVDLVDLVLLLASLAAISWSLHVWRHQRRFISRWGERFEKLQALESKLLPDPP